MKKALSVVAMLAAASLYANHTLEHAGILTLGVQEQATIASDEDAHYWRFDLHGSATVEIRSGGDSDPVGTLLDSDGRAVAENDDGGTGLNFRIERELGVGVHYVAVTLWEPSGEYGVIVQVLREGDDHGDTDASSTRLAPNIRTAGRIVPATDVDVFRIDIDRKAKTTIGTSGSGNTSGVLVDSDGRIVAAAQYGGSRDNFSMTERLNPGVYYVHVEAAGRTAYGIRYTVPESASDGPPPVEAASLLGAWFGNNLYSFGWSATPHFFVLSRLVYDGSEAFAVESDFSSSVANDPNENIYFAAVLSGPPHDYAVVYRAFDIYCASFSFSLTSPDRTAEDAVYLHGDVDEDTLACEWASANAYDATVVGAFGTDSELFAASTAGPTREMAEAYDRTVRSAAPTAYRPDVQAAVEAATKPLDAIR
ncbi:MAG: hypothetical protein OXG82_08205 [Gammaproteobacteria bacterium]|nr:hypothetical protein [Gammaproteobacteria bacterium]